MCELWLVGFPLPSFSRRHCLLVVLHDFSSYVVEGVEIKVREFQCLHSFFRGEMKESERKCYSIKFLASSFSSRSMTGWSSMSSGRSNLTFLATSFCESGLGTSGGHSAGVAARCTTCSPHHHPGLERKTPGLVDGPKRGDVL